MYDTTVNVYPKPEFDGDMSFLHKPVLKSFHGPTALGHALEKISKTLKDPDIEFDKAYNYTEQPVIDVLKHLIFEPGSYRIINTLLDIISKKLINPETNDNYAVRYIIGNYCLRVRLLRINENEGYTYIHEYDRFHYFRDPDEAFQIFSYYIELYSGFLEVIKK